MENNTVQVILALDTATSCGWAIHSNGKISDSGTWNFKSKTVGRKLSKFRTQLVETITQHHVTEIVAENIYFDQYRKAAFWSLGGMHGVLREVAETHDIPVSLIAPQQHKQYVCGFRYASKTDTEDALRRLGYQPNTDDEADAIAILLTHIRARI